jgi:hypothetical protein
MQGCKKSVRNRVGVHKAEDTSVRDISQIRESHAGIIHRDNSPAGRTWLDRDRGDNGPLAGRMTHSDGTPRLAEGLGGLYPDWDDYTLADYVNAEIRLQMAEAA